MPRILSILLVFPLLLQCSQTKSEQEKGTQLDSLVIPTHLEQIIRVDSAQNSSSEEKAECLCDEKLHGFSHHFDLTFSNNGSPFHLDSLAIWKSNPKRLEIKSLRLIDFASIPPGMSIFENVESLYLQAINHKNVQGLEIFPKLRMLRAEEERLEIDENTKWIKNIEVLNAGKTKFSGLKSFNQMPNLKEVRLSFSGFDTFPSDFKTLKCLKYFEIGAHTFGEIDLTQLNLQNMACLEFIAFQSWRENINGIPNGFSRIKTVKINHPNLTKTEKEQLKNKR